MNKRYRIPLTRILVFVLCLIENLIALISYIKGEVQNQVNGNLGSSPLIFIHLYIFIHDIHTIHTILLLSHCHTTRHITSVAAVNHLPASPVVTNV